MKFKVYFTDNKDVIYEKSEDGNPLNFLIEDGALSILEEGQELKTILVYPLHRISMIELMKG